MFSSDHGLVGAQRVIVRSYDQVGARPWKYFVCFFSNQLRPRIACEFFISSIEQRKFAVARVRFKRGDILHYNWYRNVLNNGIKEVLSSL